MVCHRHGDIYFDHIMTTKKSPPWVTGYMLAAARRFAGALSSPALGGHDTLYHHADNDLAGQLYEILHTFNVLKCLISESLFPWTPGKRDAGKQTLRAWDMKEKKQIKLTSKRQKDEDESLEW